MMFMCRVVSCVVGRGCLLWPVRSLGKILLAFTLLHSVFQGQICLLLQVFLDFLLLHQGWGSLVGCHLWGHTESDMTEWLSLTHSRTPSICPNQLCWRSWSWMVLWRATRPSRTNMKTRCPFHQRGLECKSRKSRDTWSNRQIALGVQNETGQRLTEFCQENAVVIANTLFQHLHRTFYVSGLF